MVQRARLTWYQIARGLLFIVVHALVLGALVGATVLGVRAILDPPLSEYLGMPLVFALIFIYGKWVWTPLWKLRVSNKWT